ncbi:SDR family NAD(P)-dependent oxidoreductase [Lacimicrobium alkaliphilum]|uniref:2-deoxy-D-gluconate 3-dehydrogenase n=1 Tax=Lacimicrobium alkaliphilum TaxID=1526571 RepID=A0A0U2ZNL3_9ALTE|nr:SDR family NAD(P)-dependent oxidoreductase [Lacimicrobium alkaliphilum]ALS99868.1 2-deoxy-D-gluconate 3-dehydrogenase [Lacimicrobium alkaliphilum]
MSHPQSLLSMQGHVALVTGASSGLGAHFAQVLATAGAHVILAARRKEKLNQLCARLKDAGHSAKAIAMDVTCPESIDAGIEETEASAGPVSVLINNAGVADPKRFLNIDQASWDFTMDTNLKGAWQVASKVSKRMLELQISGRIVNIASILGLRVGYGDSSYATSKAALIHLTKSMALELGRKGIRVNALCPGYFKTEINQHYFDSEKGQQYLAGILPKRLGRAHELDVPLLMLCSDAGSFINGIALPVDGGHLIGSL